MEAKRAAPPVLGQARMEGLGVRARAVAASTPFLGALVCALSWGGGFGEPLTPSIDHSLHAGLQMAAAEGLDFGPDLVFTYGPLGFLKSYLAFVAWPATLAAIYGLLLHLALSISLVWAIRRNFGIGITLVLAFLTAAFARGDLPAAAVRDDASVVILALIWSVAALDARSPDWTRRLVVWGGGPFAALELLAKLNTGIVVLGLVGLATLAIATDRRRNLAILGSTFAASLAALWVVTGQGLGDVGDFATGTLEIMAGYSSGARLDFGWEDRGYDYIVAPLVIAAAVAIAWLATRELPTPPRVAALVMVGFVSFTAAKGGFVSHEVFHMGTFYGTMLGVCLAFRLPRAPRVRWGSLAATVAVTGAAFTTAFEGFPMLNVAENLSNGAATVVKLVDRGRFDAEVEADRARLIADYDIDPRTLELLAGRGVHLDPSEAAAIWAHGLEWEPLPVFQPYAAWTPDLDLRNAEALASPAGPERVLRQNLNALGRYPAYESPAAMLALLCNFEAERTTPDWQLLRRVPDRCGEPRSIAVAEGSYGEPFEVPPAPAGSVVFARPRGLEVAGVERLRSALLRARGRQVTFSNDDRLYTLIAATAEDGLLLRAPRRLDFPPPFALAPNAADVTFLFEGGPADQPIEVEFFAVAVRPPAGG